MTAGTGARSSAPRRESVWRNADFRRLWAGETVSLFGTQVTMLALPLTAVLTLHVSPLELGVLNAGQWVPFAVLALVAGAYVDRRRRRGVLLLANLASAVLAASVPAAALAGVLSLPQLYAVAFLLGTSTVFLSTAFWAYGPFLVGRDQLGTANSALYASQSAAIIAGPGLGGLLVQALTAPVAMLADAGSFLVSWATVLAISKRESAPPGPGGERIYSQISEGLRFVLGHRYLRPIAAEAGWYNLFFNAFFTAWLLYAARGLGLRPGVIGMLSSMMGVGALVGSLLAGRIQRRFGIGPSICGSMVLGTAPWLLIPLLAGRDLLSLTLAGAAFLIAAIGVQISGVQAMTLRQATTPERLLGRMTASYRFLTFGGIPLGALLGGGLAGVIGARPAVFTAAAAIAVAPLWVLTSRLPRLREIPPPQDPAGRPRPAARGPGRAPSRPGCGTASPPTQQPEELS